TEGYIGGRGSAGSFVSDLEIARPARKATSSAKLDVVSATNALTANAFARAATGLPSVRVAPVPFRLGEPALGLFPMRLLAFRYRLTAMALLSRRAFGARHRRVWHMSHPHINSLWALRCRCRAGLPCSSGPDDQARGFSRMTMIVNFVMRTIHCRRFKDWIPW